MKRLLLVLISCVALTKAMAISEEAVVKISSRPCGNLTGGLTGSGLLVTHENETYVLTSEHVVLQSNQGICHEVKNSDLGFKKASLVAADWGMGLAVLKLIEPVQGSFASLDSLSVTPASVGTEVTAFGYLLKSTELTKNSKGSVLTTKSRFWLIPFVRELIEIESRSFGYGMSGGPVFETDSDAFFGILSNEGIRFEASGRPTHRFLVIPSEKVVSWVRFVLSQGEQFVPKMVRSGNRILTNGLAFEIKGQTAFGPIGGPEGVGRTQLSQRLLKSMRGLKKVDNSPSTSLPADALAIEVTLDESQAGGVWNFPLRDNWFKSLRSELQNRKTVRILYFVKLISEKGNKQKVRFGSLSDFFTLLQNPDLMPVTELEVNPSSNFLPKEQ